MLPNERVSEREREFLEGEGEEEEEVVSRLLVPKSTTFICMSDRQNERTSKSGCATVE